MSIWDRLKKELIDIVQFLDDSSNTLVFRFERFQNEIKNGAKLVVREGQAAVFINEGKMADVLGPGTYTLDTKNVPILATLLGWKYGF
ncbi:MAG TPA: SPFH domain-containing protein, partial [Phycisphaerales bacterium]|nr:SPFH domain-containing protein [Phycisphaerales bacterium]